MGQPATRVPANPLGKAGRKARWLGLAGGLIAALARAPRPEVAAADLRKNDYRTSTQRIGVRLTERVRNAFRPRWIREIF
jgi:hypothetical protein